MICNSVTKSGPKEPTWINQRLSCPGTACSLCEDEDEDAAEIGYTRTRSAGRRTRAAFSWFGYKRDRGLAFTKTELRSSKFQSKARPERRKASFPKTDSPVPGFGNVETESNSGERGGSSVSPTRQTGARLEQIVGRRRFRVSGVC